MQKGFNLAECRIVEGGPGPCALEVFINPTAEERRYLIEELKIDEHTLNSALDPDEISRLEFEPDHAAIIFKVPKSYSSREELLFRVSSVGSFLFHDRLVLVLSEDIPMFDGKPFSKIFSLSGLLLKLISRSIYHFLEHLKIINLISDELEQKINASMENRYLINLFTLSKSLVYYQNAISSNALLMEKLRHNAAKLGFKPDEVEALDDLIIENSQCYRQAEIYSNILASMMDARVSIVSNNLNIIMKTLTVITVYLMLPTLVVSIFSMNVNLPIRHDHPFAFWLILLLAGISILSFMIFWRRRKWV